MCYLYTSSPSMLFSVELTGCAFQETSIVLYPIHFHSQTYQSYKGVYWSEDKQERHLVSFDPVTLRCLAYIKGIFNPYAVWHSYFSIPQQSFHRERVKSLEEFFFQLWKCNWSILLKYQEIEMQIQAFTDES